MSSRSFRLLSALLLILILSTHASAAPSLTRFPYVQRPTTSTVTVVWETDVPTSSSIEYGPAGSLKLEEDISNPQVHHEVELTGLAADTTYSYRVFADGAPLMDARTFHTNKDASRTTFSFVVLGDSGSGDEHQRDVAAQILRVHPEFGLHVGDLVYPRGVAGDYGKKYFLPYRDLIASICLFTTPGNHEYFSHKGKPYFDNFSLPANNPTRSEHYYSFDYGNAHFVSIDSNLKKHGQTDTEQFAWVKKDLSATGKPWKFVFMHHPPYSSSLHGSEMRIRDNYSPLFEELSVDIVFSGHDHLYERTKQVHEYYPNNEGVIYIVTGGGGGRLYHRRHSKWNEYAKSVYHFVRVEIEGPTLRLSAIDDKGNEFDELVLDKRVPGHVVQNSPARLRIALGISVILVGMAAVLIFRST